MKNIFKTVWSCWNKTDRIVTIISLIVIIFMSIFLCKECKGNTINPDTNNVKKCMWDDEGFMPLSFENIYFIDTVDMVIYYDNYDQFDMDLEYERNPDNINEDSNLILHINRSNLVELMNRILQWISIEDYSEKYYIESMFGIGETDTGTYYITFLGN